MIYLVLFFARRLVYGIFMHIDVMILRVSGVLVLETIYLSYLILNKPLSDPGQLNIEIFNEFIITVIFYTLPLYTHFIPAAAARYEMGDINIVFMLALIVGNLIFIMRKPYESLKKRCFEKKYHLTVPAEDILVE